MLSEVNKGTEVIDETLSEDAGRFCNRSYENIIAKESGQMAFIKAQ